MNKKIVILCNPQAGKANAGRISAVVRGLEGQGAEVSRVDTVDLPALAGQMAGIIKSAPDIIVAAGGDGTINKIIAHLDGSGIPLAVLPVGTANVLAASLKIPTKAKDLVPYILDGKIREAWPGEANGTCFCCMASVGFDANIVRGVDLKLKRLISKGAYIVEAIRTLLRHRDQAFTVVADGQSYQAYGAIVTLTPFYGGRYLIAPEASPFAKGFTLVLFKSKGRISLLRYALALVQGRISRLHDAELIKAHEVEISSAIPGFVQTDGDILGNLPVRLSRRTSVHLLVPA